MLWQCTHGGSVYSRKNSIKFYYTAPEGNYVTFLQIIRHKHNEDVNCLFQIVFSIQCIYYVIGIFRSTKLGMPERKRTDLGLLCLVIIYSLFAGSVCFRVQFKTQRKKRHILFLVPVPIGISPLPHSKLYTSGQRNVFKQKQMLILYNSTAIIS